MECTFNISTSYKSIKEHPNTANYEVNGSYTNSYTRQNLALVHSDKLRRIWNDSLSLLHSSCFCCYFLILSFLSFLLSFFPSYSSRKKLCEKGVGKHLFTFLFIAFSLSLSHITSFLFWAQTDDTPSPLSLCLSLLICRHYYC